MKNMARHELIEKRIEEMLRELFEYKIFLESFYPRIQKEMKSKLADANIAKSK